MSQLKGCSSPAECWFEESTIETEVQSCRCESCGGAGCAVRAVLVEPLCLFVTASDIQE